MGNAGSMSWSVFVAHNVSSRVLAAASPFIEKLYGCNNNADQKKAISEFQEVEKEFLTTNITSNNNTLLNTQHLKQWLRFDHEVTGVERRQIETFQVTDSDSFTDLDKMYQNKIQEGKVLVLISKEKEQFADIIVLGKNKVILL